MSWRTAVEAALGVYGLFVVGALAAAVSERLRPDVDGFDVWDDEADYLDVDPDAPIPYTLDDAFVPAAWVTEHRDGGVR